MLALLLAFQIVPADRTFRCTPVRIWDGDEPIWCAEGPRVHLAGIAARASDGSCRLNQPCLRSNATGAKKTLISPVGRRTGTSRQGHALVSGPAMSCRSVGSAGGSRTAAWCSSPRIDDLSCAMVASRTVLPWPRYWRGHRCGLRSMPRGTRHDIVGLLLEGRHGPELDLPGGGAWRLDLGFLDAWRARHLIGRRVRVIGVREGFDLLSVERIEAAVR